jgi:hypothetical protein
MALPFTLKMYLKAKKRIMKNSNNSPCKNRPNLHPPKKPLKETQILP